MRSFVALLLVVLANSAIQAATPELASPSRKLCNPDKIKQTNAWVDCLQKAIDKSEADLVALNRKIAAAMQAAGMLEEPKRGENKKLFEEAQMKWLALRDDDCKSFAAHHAGLGFGAVQFRLVCLLDDTVGRTQTLRRRFGDYLQ